MRKMILKFILLLSFPFAVYCGLVYNDKVADFDYLKSFVSHVNFIGICESKHRAQMLRTTLGKFVKLLTNFDTTDQKFSLHGKKCSFIFSANSFLPNPWTIKDQCENTVQNIFKDNQYIILPKQQKKIKNEVNISTEISFSDLYHQLQQSPSNKEHIMLVDNVTNLSFPIDLAADDYTKELGLSALELLISGKLSSSKKNILSIAVVKQPHYKNYLYLHRGNISGIDFIREGAKTLMAGRTGMAALFMPQVHIQAELLVVNIPSKALCQECYESERLISQCRFLSYTPMNETSIPENLDPYKVQWSNYDIVISMDISVPTAVTKNYPSVLWGYFETEGCMLLKDQYTQLGYDVFLTQNLAWKSPATKNSINLPYVLGLPHLMAQLWPNQVPRSPAPIKGSNCTVVFDRGTHRYFSQAAQNVTFLTKLSRFCRVLGYGGADSAYYQALQNAHFFVIFGGHMQRGNALIEAAMAQALVIGNFYGQINREVFDLNERTGNLVSESVLLSRLEEISSNATMYSSYLRDQNWRLFKHGFLEPISALMQASKKKRHSLK